MVNVRNYLLYATTGLLIVTLCTGQVLKAAEPSIATAKETESSTVEDGGSGPYKAIQASDSSIPTHTIYRPKDLSVFGENTKLPILAWGNGGCSNSNSMHQNYLSEIASNGFLVVAIGPYQPAGQRRGRGGGMMGGMGAPGGMPGGPMGAMAGGVPGGARGGAASGMRGGATGGARRGAGGGMSGTQSSQLLDAINWAIAQNNDKDSMYYNKIDVSKIAVAGHSCGGLQALEVSTDPRITTTLVVDSGILNTGGGAPGRRGPMPGGMPGGPMGAMQGDAADGARRGAGGGMPEGARGGMIGGARGGGMGGMPALTKDHLDKLHGPVLYLLGGSSDVAYDNGMDDFKRIEKIPVFVASEDVGHGGTFTQPHGGDWAMVSTAWLKWQLKGDKEAGKLFTGDPCGLAQDKKWTVEKKNIP